MFLSWKFLTNDLHWNCRQMANDKHISPWCHCLCFGKVLWIHNNKTIDGFSLKLNSNFSKIYFSVFLLGKFFKFWLPPLLYFFLLYIPIIHSITCILPINQKFWRLPSWSVWNNENSNIGWIGLMQIFYDHFSSGIFWKYWTLFKRSFHGKLKRIHV